jgi:hypothetical protein
MNPRAPKETRLGKEQEEEKRGVGDVNTVIKQELTNISLQRRRRRCYQQKSVRGKNKIKKEKQPRLLFGAGITPFG